MKPKIVVKKNLIIFRRLDQWDKIWAQLLEEHGPKIAISYVLKRELGFTIRNHTEWIPFDKSGDRLRHYAEEQKHLDFYSESMQSWFMLRYLNNSAGADTQ